jgi:hypothetical protein
MIKRKKKTCKTCNKEKYIFSKGNCYECTPKKPIRKSPLKAQKKKAIKQRSKTLSKRLQKYYILREAYLKDHPVCEVCYIQKACEIHHRAGRIGENLYQQFIAVDAECHRRIEMNPEWAKEQGYSISRLKD